MSDEGVIRKAAIEAVNQASRERKAIREFVRAARVFLVAPNPALRECLDRLFTSLPEWTKELS